MEAAIFFVVISIIIIGNIISRVFDSDRIENYFSKDGNKIISKHESFFGNGWAGDDNRIYKVKYEDKEGNVKETTVKTSMLSGVYKTHEKTIKKSRRQENLETENARLRRELEALKRKK